MMKRLLILCFTLLSSYLSAQNITLYSQSIPGLFQTDKQGVYDRIIQLITAQNDHFEHKVMPNNRAFRAFSNCLNCCYSPSNLNPDFYSYSEDIQSTLPFNTAKAYIISHKGGQIYSNLKQLSGKRVGIERGINYGKAVATADFIPSITNSLLQNFNMMLINRIDAMIAYAPDIHQAFKDVDAAQFQYQKGQPIAIHSDALVCRGVEQGFIEEFNTGLKSLRNSGELQQILGELYVAP